ncbi:P-loop containing nucleoside triphosphate hydrolase protein [Armillaria borealis]|uniref:P-loop containing nucleoside triphosphate hydrolase protein n=1 Tax=Armillaria borealis TaxID=47425 RepID=A0AA39JIR1_9AGAR|nr:P-loop containing nucleoside triphosphate hydrolase protein [Armillaria borealis]
MKENSPFSAVAPVDVGVRKLTVQAYSSSATGLECLKSQTILNSVNSEFLRSSLTGIIGSSGSGKTTFLNILSHRMKGKNLCIRGQLYYNASPSLSSVSYAYVTQTEVFLPTLTVRETLMYAADLRLPDSIGHKKRHGLVEEIILELGLTDCADTLVGDRLAKKGCSGGERRRLSLGVQLLGNPSVLFLDEPTTGLDATSAYQLVKTLKSLAKKGRTIIMTLHQPRSEVFLLLDAVTLLAQGHSLYSGPAADAVPWFERRLPPPGPHVNPADYLINIGAIDTRTRGADDVGRARVNMLIAAWKEESAVRFPRIKPAILSSSDPPVFIHNRCKVPFGRVVCTLVSRTLKSTIRDPWGVIASWIEAVLMGLAVGSVFLQLPDSMAGIRSRQAALYVSVGFQGYLVFIYEVYRLTSIDMPLFDRENSEGVVGVLPWIISQRIAHGVLEDIIVPLVFSGISYLMIGLAPSATRFLYYFIVILLVHYASLTFAGLSVSISRYFALSTLLTNLAFAVHTHVCGFFLQADSIPVYLRWAKWTSHLFYGFTALVNNEFKDRDFDCPLNDSDPHSSLDCNTYRGDYIIESLAVPSQNWSTIPIIAILGFIAFYSLAQILILHLFAVNTVILSHAQHSSDRKIKEVHCTNIEHSPRFNTEGIEVDLENYSLRVRIRGGACISIIQGVNTRFEHGKINVILGPSGSGKSSLLNSMAHRLRSTSYTTEGQMKLNGISATRDRIRSLCSYVTQDDTLPSLMSKKQKHQKADEVMKKMGLKDCADTLVGNDMLKGISGGEKRRVSIAIQVLTEPQVLMLDEPTSGLDTFTAASIMDVLRQLADEGRTIITVLHQSSSEVFEHFGNVLLLTKDGKAAYSGPASGMLEYMRSVGLGCPSTMNPADFVRGRLSREKVDLLVEALRNGERRTLNEETPKASPLPNDATQLERKMAPITTSLPILLKRGVLAFSRRPGVVQARFGNAVGLGIVSALFFSPLGHDYISIQNRIGCIQGILPSKYRSVRPLCKVIEIRTVYLVGVLQNMAIYPTERDIFYQEHGDDAYSIESFFLAYTILELPLEVVACFTFSALAAIATNLLRTFDMFLVVTLNALCMVNAGESLGIIFNTIFHENPGLALNVVNVILCVMMFMAGLMSADMPAFLQGINKVSPLGYVIRNIMPLAFSGQMFTCDDNQRLYDGSCAVSAGEQVLEMYNMNEDAVPLNLGAVVVTMLVYRFLAYIVVKVAKARFGIQWRNN